MSPPTLDIEMLRRGDPVATRTFLTIVARVARRYVDSPADAESVACEVLAELLAKLERGESPEQLQAWARSAARNAARRVLSRQRKVAAQFASELHTKPSVATLSQIHRWREALACVQRTMVMMPKPIQHAIVATAVDGRSVESVAKELGMPSSTVRNNLRRARRKFRRELTDEQKLERLSEFARHVREARGDSSSYGVPPPEPSSRAEASSSAKR